MAVNVGRTAGTDTALRNLVFERLHLGLEFTFALVEVSDITNCVDFFFMLGDLLPGLLQLDLRRKKIDIEQNLNRYGVLTLAALRLSSIFPRCLFACSTSSIFDCRSLSFTRTCDQANSILSSLAFAFCLRA